MSKINGPPKFNPPKIDFGGQWFEPPSFCEPDSETLNKSFIHNSSSAQSVDHAASFGTLDKFLSKEFSFKISLLVKLKSFK